MKVVVIGAGASGLAAALEAAKKGHRVTVLELKNQPGKKISATGNGRCNITNKNMNADCYHCDDYDFLKGVLEKISYDEIEEYFGKMGLMLTSAGNYVYPYSKQAAGVVRVFMNNCNDRGVEFVYNCNVKNIEKTGSEFKVTGNVTENNGTQKICIRCDRVVVAAGGKASKVFGSDGSGYYLLSKLSHTVTDVVPSLVPLVCSEKYINNYMKNLSGVRSDVTVRLYSGDCKEVMNLSRGEIQLTEYGVSGIVVFQLSGKVNEMLKNRGKIELSVDFMPDVEEGELEKLIYGYMSLSYAENSDKIKLIENFIENNLNEKLARVIIRDVKNDIGKIDTKDETAVEKYIKKLVRKIKNFIFEIVDSRGFDNAQVCRGGISLREIDHNFQSKIVEGLYIVGEVLNVDGMCGGYNLHFAFASGIIAGRNM